MKSYFQSYPEFLASGGSHKTSTIKPTQLLPAIVANMARLNKEFTLNVNGRLPKNMDGMLVDAFEQSHLQQPFYTQHCEYRSYRYGSVSKNRIRIDFTIQYRMNRSHEKWMVEEMNQILADSIRPNMTTLEKVVAVHDYIARTFTYDLNTAGSPYAVYTFMKEKHGVCMAYALLFEKMMELLEIPCYYVIGQAVGEGDAGHAWNMVEIDGEWYHVDVTWDDLSSKSKNHEIRYRYFLVSDEKMKRDHTWNLRDYPPCTSERFASLHALYDVCIVGNFLYYPHQKTVLLYALDMSKSHLQPDKLLDTRVQMVKYLDGMLYFSNYSNKGYLCCYDLVTKEVRELKELQVMSIQSCEAGLEVTYKDETTELIEKAMEEIEAVEGTDEFAEVATIEATQKIPFIHFDQTWMASMEQTNPGTTICFTDNEGVELFLNCSQPQLTVDLFIDKGLHLHLTTKRKAFTLEQPAILKLPIRLLPAFKGQLFTRMPSGALVEAQYKEIDDLLYIQLVSSTEFIF
ncbi:MAG: DUF5050 domain-containing protein [Kurthia sp.]|nr:DUF5050 domain-containing protein [Candidatus Kurthia equi]